MKKALLFVLTLLSFQAIAQKNTDTRVFEMRIYYAEPGKLPTLMKRFEKHTRKLFKKHGMENIAYWVPTDNQTNRLVYVLAYPDMQAREASWKAFMADPVWIKVKAKSEEKGKVINRIESVFMKASDFSPAILPQKKDRRMYQMVTYTASPGKFDALLERTRDHEMPLWKTYGAVNVAYWTTLEKDNAQPKLIFLLSHYREADALKELDGLTKDSRWIKAKADSDRNGALVEKEESVYLKGVLFFKK